MSSHVLICISYLKCLFISFVLLQKNFFLLFSFRSSWYILENRPSSDVSVANIFSQYVAHFLILLLEFFPEQKVLILMNSSLSLLSRTHHAFDVISKNQYLCKSLGFLLCYLLLLLLSRFSRVRLCATPETAAHQAPPSPGFSGQEHWSGLPLPSPTHESEK